MAEELKNAPTPDKDYSDFFRDPELADKYPDVNLPPATFVAHQGKILTFASGQSLSIVFPVGEAQTNPVGTLQGGILSSFFDDAFGMLCFASLHRPCVTIDLSVNFIRPVKPGSFVIIHAVCKGRGRKLLQVSAEAVNGEEKLVATATSNLMVVES
jgi:uncharacterized protein (TIGR00369 family)